MPRYDDPLTGAMMEELRAAAEAGRLESRHERMEPYERPRSRLDDFRLLLQVLTPKKGFPSIGEATYQSKRQIDKRMIAKYTRTPGQIKVYRRAEEDLRRRGLPTGGKEYNQTVRRIEREMMERGELRNDPWYGQIQEIERLGKKHPEMSPAERARRAHKKFYPQEHEPQRDERIRGGGPLSQLAAWSELIGPALVSRVMNLRYGPEEIEPGVLEIPEHELGRPSMPRRPRKPEML